MTFDELFAFAQAWRGVYPQFAYSEAAFEVICEDFAEFDAADVNAAFRDVRRSSEMMPPLSEFRRKCQERQQHSVKQQKRDIAAKFASVPFLREYIIQQAQAWLRSLPAPDAADALQQILSVNPRMMDAEGISAWWQWDGYVLEAAVLLKAQIAAGAWTFSNEAFAAFQEHRRKECAALTAAHNELANVIPFPAKPTPPVVPASRRDPAWRRQPQDVDLERQLQRLATQRAEMARKVG